MTNYDLKWAREWKGLTQAQAAKELGVHRDTWGRWETGARAIPPRKWQLFLKRIGLPHDQIPKRRQYDAKGYPVGFDRTPYAETDTRDGDVDAEEAALKTIEGDEYLARARERFMLCEAGTYENPTRFAAECREEDRQIAAGKAPRSFDEIHPVEGAQKRAIEAQLLAWQRDPEGMAAQVRARNAKRSLEDRTYAARLEVIIRDQQERAKLWVSQHARGHDLV